MEICFPMHHHTTNFCFTGNKTELFKLAFYLGKPFTLKHILITQSHTVAMNESKLKLMANDTIKGCGFYFVFRVVEEFQLHF